MQRNIKREIENLRDTERLLNLRLLYLYEKSSQLRQNTLDNKENKKKAAQFILRYKIVEKEIPILEKQWFSVFEYILALEGAVLWKEVYECLKMSAEFMKRVNQRIEKLDPSAVVSNAQVVMDEYRTISETLTVWSDEQGEIDDQDLKLILNGGKEEKRRPAWKQELGGDDQEEEMFSELDTKRTRAVQSLPAVPSTPLPKLGQTVKQLV